MGLFSSKSGNTQPSTSDESANLARSRARHRLIGAAVLLAVGVIGFPMIFETQPRHGPAEIPRVVQRNDAKVDASTLPKVAERAATPPSPTASGASAEVAGSARAGDAERGNPMASGPVDRVPAPAPQASAVLTTPQSTAAAAAATTAVAAAAAPKPVAKPAAAEPKAVAVLANPAPNASAHAAASKPAAASTGAGRFVVQVGAYAQDAGVREARGMLEKAGLRSYTQVIKTSAGKRTRVRAGPYANREEADAAAAKARAAGLTPSVVPLD